MPDGRAPLLVRALGGGRPPPRRAARRAFPPRDRASDAPRAPRERAQRELLLRRARGRVRLRGRPRRPPPERVHRLVAPTASSSRRAEILAGLVPTGVSWNATGYTLAVSYGRHDVPGWSDSKGAICAWNLRRGDVDAREEPDAFIETDNCVQCLRFHPEHPALVAAGTLDGDVFVFSLDESDAARRDGDPLVAKSSARPATLAHREPVTGVHWQFDLAEASKRADATLAYDLVSVAGDGRALVWDWRPDARAPPGKKSRRSNSDTRSSRPTPRPGAPRRGASPARASRPTPRHPGAAARFFRPPHRNLAAP